VLPLDKWTAPCTVLNRDQTLILRVLREYADQLHIDVIPENIQVVVVDAIDAAALGEDV
jgi:hypothetical protein